MLQQTQVATVIPYFERWMARFPTCVALSSATEDEVLAAWQGLGYYSRARNLHRAACQIVVRHGGVVPSSVDAISELPGIGRYTAGAIASFAFDQPVAAVDANIARVLSRLFDLQVPIDTTLGSKALWDFATLLLPESAGGLHTSALMELGALVCVPTRPQCLICPVRSYCAAEKPELLPLKRPRRAVVDLVESCGWITDGSRILLEQQTGPRWRGLWKLPLIETASSSGDSRIQDPPTDEAGAPLLCLVYPFTHHRVTLSLFAGETPHVLLSNQAWFAADPEILPAMPSPHRRATLRMFAARVGAR